MKHTIVRLTTKHLSKALLLRDQIFPGLNKAEYATLEASVRDLGNIKTKLGVDELHYWVAIDSDDTVHGIIGLYSEIDDPKERIWLGWYGVDETVRGSGLGGKLLDFAIHESRCRGYEELKLYTTTADEYTAARRLYERKGFIDVTPSKKAKTRYYSLQC